MLKSIADIFNALSKKQQRDFLKLQPLIVLMSGLEILNIVLISAFIEVISNPELIPSNSVYVYTLTINPSLSNSGFIFYCAILLLIFISCSAALSMFTVWRLAYFASVTGAELSKALFDNYIAKGWIYHASVNSAELVKNITFQTQRFTGGVLNPLVQLTAKLAVALGIIAAMFIQDWSAALVVSGILSSAYILLFSTVKRLLHRNGQFVTSSMSNRYKIASEALNGIRDVIMFNKRDYYSRNFEKSSLDFARATGNNVALISTPKYFIEWLALSLAVLALIYFNSRTGLNFQSILPQIIFFILAGSKLIPALQQIYTIISSIRADISSFEVFQCDKQDSSNLVNSVVSGKIDFKASIKLNDVSFSYPNAERAALSNISLTINKNDTIGIVGPSGSGKSTLVDMLAGLIAPDNGTLKIDDVELDERNIFNWREKIGYHSQNTFISDGNVAQNIAFGCEEAEIDYERVDDIIELVALSNVIARSQNGVFEAVGEKGVKLSGGQLQRLGIGRTMYTDPDLIIFDEATAALDNRTEERILDTVKRLKGKKTLVMIAHRLTTLIDCDTIFVIDEGTLVAHGTYSELKQTNEHFKDLKGME